VDHLIAMSTPEHFSMLQVFGELADNAWDADATTVTAGFVKNKRDTLFMFEDDGHGFSDPLDLLVIGKRKDRRGKARFQSGQHGVGFKEASLWLGGPDSKVRIATICEGQKLTIEIDWRAIIRSREWVIPGKCIRRRAAAPGERGTKITIDPVRRNVPIGAAWDKLVANISYEYAPAISRGDTILLKRRDSDQTERLRGYKSPALEPGFVQTRVCVPTKDGKQLTAKVLFGIVKDRASNLYPGITYVYGPRVLVGSTSYGCGSGFPISGVFGIVELEQEWPVSKNKGGIDQYADELFDAVFNAIELVLHRAQKLKEELASEAFQDAVQEVVDIGLQQQRPNAKAARGEGDKTGTQASTGDGAKHGRAKNIQEGEGFHDPRNGCADGGKWKGKTSKRAKPVTIEWTESAVLGDQIGKCEPGGTVFLNAKNPALAAAREAGHIDAVAAHVMWLKYAAELFAGRKGQVDIHGQSEDLTRISENVGKAMALGCAYNGVAIVPAKVAR